MSRSDTSEKGLESLIVAAMTGVAAPAVKGPTSLYGGGGWLLGCWQDYDREYAVDLGLRPPEEILNANCQQHPLGHILGACHDLPCRSDCRRRT